MHPVVNSFDQDIFSLSNLFTTAECQEFIARGEAIGFETASVSTSSGPQMLTKIRNNDRVIFDDSELAAAMWEKVKEYVPQEIEGGRSIGLNPRFRFYRYDPGQRFKRHKDGRVDIAPNVQSRLTFLIYLNDGYEGGETIFSDYTFENEKALVHEIKVSPEIGMGLFFIHERMHEGAPITSGRKYVLRTDVIFEG